MNRSHHNNLWPTRWRRAASGLLVGAASLAIAGSSSEPARAEPPAMRSVKDVRPRIPDELDRPVRRETSSHRGWEIREDQFTIAANTSLEDARWAAAQVAKARGEMANLADRFTSVHRAADFGLNSLQVVIDGQPLRQRNAPPATINVVGIQTQVQINVAPGQPGLKEQLGRLREGAAFALLHSAELDAELPPWVAGGLAAHIAQQGLTADAPKPNDYPPRGEQVGSQQWRSKRIAQDRLGPQPEDQTAAASRVGFLLSGEDATYAPEFLAAIGQAIQRGRTQAAASSPPLRQNESERPAANTRFDQLIAGHQTSYDAWLKDPQAGQPAFVPDEKASPELAREEREMLVVLKLQRRFQATTTLPTSVKISIFDPATRQTNTAKPSSSQPPAISELVARLSDRSQPPVGTLDADGRLLLSTDRERIAALLGWDGQRYRSLRSGEQWMLATRLADGRELHGWLEGNPEQPGRPAAKFVVVELGKPGTTKPLPRDPAAAKTEPKVTVR